MNELSKLSDQEILRNVEKLSSVEHETTLALLQYLNELDQRKLYLELGYSSLFTYCTEKLRYSESSAGRRIRTARSAAKFPEIFALLVSKAVNISTVSLVASILDEQNKESILFSIKNKSQREVEKIVSSYRPVEKAIREVITPVAIVKSVSPVVEVRAEEKISNDSGVRSGRDFSESSPTQVVEVEQLYKIQFGADLEFMELLKRLQELGGGNVPEALKRAMRVYLKAKDPVLRAKRREVRLAKPKVAVRRRSRAIPAAMRDTVILRDNCQCSFVGKDGIRCSERRNLQIDHIQPFALGGGAERENLRALCGKHNRHAAQRVFGKAFMARYLR